LTLLALRTSDLKKVEKVEIEHGFSKETIISAKKIVFSRQKSTSRKNLIYCLQSQYFFFRKKLDFGK